MKYMDVRVRLPVQKLGFFIDDLPSYAQMIGYDKLTPTNGEANGNYLPRKGTAAEAALKIFKISPMTRAEVIRTLNKKFKVPAVSSGIGTLIKHQLIVKQRDGKYASAH